MASAPDNSNRNLTKNQSLFLFFLAFSAQTALHINSYWFPSMFDLVQEHATPGVLTKSAESCTTRAPVLTDQPFRLLPSVFTKS